MIARIFAYDGLRQCSTITNIQYAFMTVIRYSPGKFCTVSVVI